MPRSTIAYVSATLAALLLAPPPALAQSGPDAEDARNRQTFAASFFDDHAPATALDMLNRVPGFTLDNGDQQRRGLADSFGNVLIDGIRPASKSLSLETVLTRIPSQRVERIELLTGAALTGITQPADLMANIVLRNDVADTGTYQLIWRNFSGGRSMPGGSVNWTRNQGSTEVSAGLDFSLWSPRVNRNRSLQTLQNSAVGTSVESDQVLDREFAPSLSVSHTRPTGSRLQLDASGRYWTWTRNFFQTQADPSGPRYTTSQTRNHGSGLRISASWARPWSDTLNAETRLLASREAMHNGPERVGSFTESGLTAAQIIRFNDLQHEYVLRHGFTWTPTADRMFEFGGEVAVNTGETALAIDRETDGVRTPVDLPIAHTNIREDRAEIFVRHLWHVSPRLDLTAALRVETSRLDQAGDARQTRDFNYLKPEFRLDYRLSPTQTLRSGIRREVDQLSFSKFASSVDVTDSNATLGNPDYVPERSWIADLVYEHRWSEKAALVLEADFTRVEDLDDWIPVFEGVQVFDAPGNIGDGSRWRTQLDLTLPLDPVGLPHATLQTEAVVQRTEVTDPLTGQVRPWSGTSDQSVALDFRQNLPDQHLAWGATYRWRSDWQVFRAAELRSESVNGGNLSLFVERSQWHGLTIKLGVQDVFESGRDRSRQFFTGDRAHGQSDAIENRHAGRGRLAYLQVTGQF